MFYIMCVYILYEPPYPGKHTSIYIRTRSSGVTDAQRHARQWPRQATVTYYTPLPTHHPPPPRQHRGHYLLNAGNTAATYHSDAKQRV